MILSISVYLQQNYCDIIQNVCNKITYLGKTSHILNIFKQSYIFHNVFKVNNIYKITDYLHKGRDTYESLIIVSDFKNFFAHLYLQFNIFPR